MALVSTWLFKHVVPNRCSRSGTSLRTHKLSLFCDTSS